MSSSIPAPFLNPLPPCRHGPDNPDHPRHFKIALIHYDSRIRSPHEAIPRLRFWKALAATYPDEQELKYIRESDEAPKFAFSTIVETLTCGLPGLGKGPSSSGMGLTWLTCLMISKVPVSRAEIMSLSSLHNLRALDVCGYELQCEIPYGSTQKPLDIDDSVIRNMVTPTSAPL